MHRQRPKTRLPLAGAFALVGALALLASACGGAGPRAEPDASALDGGAARDGAAVDGAAVDAAPAADAPAGDATADGPPADGPAVDSAPLDATEPACTTYGDPVVAGTVAEAELAELSGLAASRRNPGVYYAHNDSGDEARFFALASNGAALGELMLDGASAKDWEDLAVGPCPAGWCVYIGDVGDNDLVRTDLAILRVAEPEVSGAVGQVTVTYERFPIAYPDGAHNCETLLVDPSTGDVYLVTKVSGAPSKVYRYPAPLDDSTTATLEHVTDVTIPAGVVLVTGGDVHPSGSRVLLRTYTRLWELRAAPGASFATVLAATPLSVPVALEVQGEAVAYTADGSGYVTASEGSHPALSLVTCIDQ